MLDVFKYEARPAYPHMSKADTAIWERCLVEFPTLFETCQYDYHVGDAPPFNTLYDDDTDLNQDKLYRKRIDVVGQTAQETWIVEVKPNAGFSAIGQVKGYEALYVRDAHGQKPTKTMIVTDNASADMKFMCEREGVKLIVV